jgi:hypothetical protein
LFVKVYQEVHIQEISGHKIRDRRLQDSLSGTYIFFFFKFYMIVKFSKLLSFISSLFISLSSLIQISYFEFLITSEFNLGFSVPRLPLWTTHVVNSFIALDSKFGQIKGFGRLSVRIFINPIF